MIRRLPLLTIALSLAACGGEPDATAQINRLDAELLATNASDTAGDPALRAALQDQIMVDPGLTRQANADAIRPPTEPQSGAVPPDLPITPGAAEKEALRSAPAATAGCPQCAAARRALTLGALAAAQGGAPGRCASNVAYSAAWANRLPAGVPLYPDARVAEAAGADGDGCALRVVSFTTAAPVQRLLDWYYTRTNAAGFSAQHHAEGDQHVLGGTKAGSAFMVYMKPRAGGGTEVDLMADGR